MVKGKIKFNHQLWRQLGLFTVYVLTLLMSPFYIYQKIGENDSARFTIFLGEHSLYNAKEFEGLLNSYFTISLVILFVLPVLAIFLKYLLNHPLLYKAKHNLVQKRILQFPIDDHQHAPRIFLIWERQQPACHISFR